MFQVRRTGKPQRLTDARDKLESARLHYIGNSDYAAEQLAAAIDDILSYLEGNQ